MPMNCRVGLLGENLLECFEKAVLRDVISVVNPGSF